MKTINETSQQTTGAKYFMTQLINAGYEIIHTGGGCTALEKEIGACNVMITQDASHEIKEEYMDDLGLCIGVYPDDLEGQHLLFINPTHTNWNIIYSLVLQAENVAKSIDAISAFEKVES